MSVRYWRVQNKSVDILLYFNQIKLGMPAFRFMLVGVISLQFLASFGNMGTVEYNCVSDF